ncbi:MAG: PEP-utilizing enzyme [Ilumatobacteraceae bacterium]
MTIEWTPPAGGLWELETQHVRGGQSRIFQERAPRAFRSGFAGAAIRYGLPLEYLDVRFVNDHCYARMRPVGAPEPRPGKPNSPPPDVVLRLLTRLHPELRRRTKAARRAIERRLWHEDRRRWEEHDRPAMHATGRAMQAEPLDLLDDDALINHLRRAADHLERGIAMHIRLTPVHGLPVGRLVRSCRQWGIGDGESFALLTGGSPASIASAAGLAAIASACAAAGVAPTSLDDVRAAGPDAAAALEHYLADHGWRAITQYSPSGLTLIEQPDVLLRAICAAVRDSAAVPFPNADVVRDRVPVAQRPRFDALLDDARRCYGVRDENVALTFMWPAGLVRRAVLECGRRLAARGLVADEAHVFALGEDEIAAALAGDTSVGAVSASRTARRDAATADGAPTHLGDDEGPPPDPGLFPAPVAELLRAVLLGFELEVAFQGERRGDADWSGTGVGIGTEPYTGRACVAAAAEDALARLRAGEVLVTTLTTPAFEAIMPVAGAVVTEVGGLMSHTAICCREYGIPAVLRVAGATTHIPDGALVTVDPSSGRVLVEVSRTTTDPGAREP